MIDHKLLNNVINYEWEMFRLVNGEDRVSCQEDREMFQKMRSAQFSAWSEDAVRSYLDDLMNAHFTGRNLVREKYIHMMKSTVPEDYETLKIQLPEITKEKIELAGEIWKHMLEQTERMRVKYPNIALSGRPMRSAEETDGWASVETYQISELLTYSEKTLKELLKHIEMLESMGIDLAYEIQKNSVLNLGYSSMDEAEKAASNIGY